MTTPSLISNSGDRSRDPYQRTKKKKKSSQLKHHQQQQQQQQNEQEQSHAKWRSQTQQQIYSSKLRQALTSVNLASSGYGPRRGKAVREAADRVLAVAAKGRTRWSRAILTNRLKLKFRKHHKRTRAVVGPGRPKKPKVSVFRLKGKTLPAVQRKVRVLGRLVPGCKKEALPIILEEAIDYIPALEMQVRAMTALADLLLGSTSSSSSSSNASASN